ncbi:MAG: hypothetical protein A2Y62_21395 [Candidatus Fischerbacteria bacterium RBG_13_37_8]|uniref:VWFA domain-containing protein n=1 Tax=Candidatus Fischerbacteria bacterium RBG_13_37_8 TaxID=1817863 RepID=A0A1F5VTJ3_9BACT|nr:MAG: hypothetical protein A2Y62_21395 [Candidatus Fischerbacteria bacterium RBG_13_37_8]
MKLFHEQITILTSLLLFLLLLPALCAFAEDNVHIKIISPTENDTIAGKTRIIIDIIGDKEKIEKVEFYIDKKFVHVVFEPPYVFTFDFGLTPAERIIKVLGYVDGLVKTSDAIRTKAYKLSYLIGVKLVEVHTSVLDRKSVPIKGLYKNEFIVFDNDAEQKITHFDREKVPLYLVLLLDKSASMKYKIETAKELTKKFISGIIGKTDYISFIAFDDEIHLMNRFTQNTSDIFTSIDSLQAEGGTALNDAIAYSYSLFEPGMRRKTIIIVTDGKDESSHLNASQMLNLCRKGGMPIFSIAQGQGLNVKELKEYLQLIAENTGGLTITAEKIKDLKKSFDYIEEVIKSQYLLGYEVHDNYPKGWHYIQVKLKTMKHTVLYTPTMYLEE